MTRIDITRKAFDGTPVLGAISLTIRPGETVALVGPSGIGKTTLLRIVAGIDTAFEGSIDRPENCAIVFQEPTLLPWRSASDNLRVVHPNLLVDDLSDALAQVGLAGKEEMYPGQLSLGQQRRLALARAIAGKPQLLIMDEPFASLDEDTKDNMLALTESLIARHRPAALFVTHSPEEAERLGDRTMTLVPGPDGAVIDTTNTHAKTESGPIAS